MGVNFLVSYFAALRPLPVVAADVNKYRFGLIDAEMWKEIETETFRIKNRFIEREITFAEKDENIFKNNIF